MRAPTGQALAARAQIAEPALAANPASQRELTALVAAIDRATGVIEQLLVLSRLQGGQTGIDGVDFSTLTARDFVPMAIAKRQQVGPTSSCGEMPTH